MNESFSLIAFFLHKPLIAQLLNSFNRSILEARLSSIKHLETIMPEVAVQSVFTDAVLHQLESGKIPSLEEKLLTGQALSKGELVWFQNDFYFKGTVNAARKLKTGVKPAYAEIHTKLERYNNIEITGKFNVDHLFGDSAVGFLSARQNVFIFAYVQESRIDHIVLRPVLIGNKIYNQPGAQFAGYYPLKIDIEDINEFKEVTNLPFTKLDINENKTFREQDIKQWFAEILSEGHVPKDWGGEYSDLFTNHIHYKNQRKNAAFLLKGRAKFHPMTVKDLGASGNQIVRLYDEPADIYVLQHCHYVKTEIHKTMDAFSARFHRISRYCIIDGIDTLRILKAYKKI